MKQYRLERNLLSQYSADNKKSIHFEDIEVTSYNSFMKWFYRQVYSVNYFGAVIKGIKLIMGEAQACHRQGVHHAEVSRLART